MHIETTDTDGVAIVRLQRPPANAMEPAFLAEIAETFDRLGNAAGTEAVVLTGTGNTFSAGMDLKFAAHAGAVQSDEIVHAFNHTFAAAYAFEKPLIAALNGHAIAGGMVLALCCDYRIAPTDDSLFGLTEVRVGVPFPEVAFNIIADQLGPDALRKMVQFGENVGPETALSWGAVDEITNRDTILARAIAKAQQCRQIPTRGYKHVKQQLRAQVIEKNQMLVTSKSDKYLGRWLDDAARQAALKVLNG